jgi:hypothetical protein
VYRNPAGMQRLAAGNRKMASQSLFINGCYQFELHRNHNREAVNKLGDLT